MGTRKYHAFVIGDPIEQSQSPKIHDAAYRFLGIENDWEYTRRRITLNTLPQFIDEIRRDDSFRGCSVTMPLKQEVIQYLDRVDEVAKQADAVNCIIREQDGKLIGYNTDIDGIDRCLRYSGKYCSPSSNSNSLILGSGATARSSYLALVQLGFKNIKIASRRRPDWAFPADNSNGSTLEYIQEHVDINITTNLISAIEAADAIVTTLPWDGAKSILTQPEVTDALACKNHLECAFPATLNTSIDGSNMLIHQAIKQIKLMVHPFICVNDDAKDGEYKKLFDVMKTAINCCAN